MTFNELLETVPPEVKAAIEEIEHKAGTTDADWEFVKAAGELLAAAKAASVVPVEVIDCYCDAFAYSGVVRVLCKSGEDARKVTKWIRGQSKDKSFPAT